MNSEAKGTKMAENDKDPKKLSLSPKGTLSLKAPVGAPARQNVAMGRSAKPVAVEVKKKRGAQAEAARQAEDKATQDLHLTTAESEARKRALQQAQAAPKEQSTVPYQRLVIKNQPQEEAAPEAAAPSAAAIEAMSPAEKAREQEMAKMRQLNQAEESERRRRENETRTSRPATSLRPAATSADDKSPPGRKGDF